MSENEEKMAGGAGKEGFKIEDRRKFTAEGDPIVSDGETDEERESAPATEKAEERKSEEPEAQAQESAEDDVDFAGFLLSLATSAMAHLGEVPDPETGSTTENLPAAKQMIDILSILQKKTKGNLERDEERLLDNLLYELRMKYLKKSQLVKF